MEEKFIKGLELSRAFFTEAVKPILDEKFADLVYSAGRFNGGSDVLGYDTPRSMDHDWGCRLELYLRKEDLDRPAAPAIRHKTPNAPNRIGRVCGLPNPVCPACQLATPRGANRATLKASSIRIIDGMRNLLKNGR